MYSTCSVQACRPDLVVPRKIRMMTVLRSYHIQPKRQVTLAFKFPFLYLGLPLLSYHPRFTVSFSTTNPSSKRRQAVTVRPSPLSRAWAKALKLRRLSSTYSSCLLLNTYATDKWSSWVLLCSSRICSVYALRICISVRSAYTAVSSSVIVGEARHTYGSKLSSIFSIHLLSE